MLPDLQQTPVYFQHSSSQHMAPAMPLNMKECSSCPLAMLTMSTTPSLEQSPLLEPSQAPLNISSFLAPLVVCNWPTDTITIQKVASQQAVQTWNSVSLVIFRHSSLAARIVGAEHQSSKSSCSRDFQREAPSSVLSLLQFFT